ncbi:Apolipoprotein N-acyltransferase (plasmid) [Pseudoseohaeicola sp. NH-UV-7]|uniref:apolipoprotein N-acyltransferase n=1 Tax=Sulfitobacter sp. TBRI5 TaxID=2989732 RepID=UPI003A611CF9
MNLLRRARQIRTTLPDASPSRAYAYGVTAGAGTALGLAPFDLWPVAVFGLIAGYVLFSAAATLRRSSLIGWAFGTGYFAVALHWIVEPFAVDAARHLWMAPFALVFMATGLALFWGAAFALAHWLAPPPARWTQGVALALCLGLAELARSYVLTGFPWAVLSQIWVSTQAIQWISVIGPHGLVLLALLAVWMPLSVTGGAVRRAISFVPALCLGAGALLWPDTAPVAGSDAPIIRLIQPNAAQRDKWNPDMIPLFFDRQVAFTRAPGQTGQRPDLIVWPETAVPTLLEYANGAFDVITDAAQGSTVVMGIQRQNDARLFNSMVVLDGNGTLTGIYDKHHLVPFGEYIPFGSVLGQFGLRGLAAEDGDGFSAGPGPALLDLGKAGRALALICYEAIFPQDVNRAPTRPDFLLQATNDAWFGTFSGPYQHLAQARMRAIEQGVPMVRAANTGVSAIIDAQGHVLRHLALDTSGFIDAPLPPARAATWYSKTGDLPVLLVLLAGLFALAAVNLSARSKL